MRRNCHLPFFSFTQEQLHDLSLKATKSEDSSQHARKIVAHCKETGWVLTLWLKQTSQIWWHTLDFIVSPYFTVWHEGNDCTPAPRSTPWGVEMSFHTIPLAILLSSYPQLEKGKSRWKRFASTTCKRSCTQIIFMEQGMHDIPRPNWRHHGTPC